MKSFLLLSAALSMLLLASCKTNDIHPLHPSRLAGEWINGGGDLLNLKIDNTFTLDLREQNKPEISGEFTADDKEIKFTNRKSIAVVQCNHTDGAYRLEQQGATLWLRLSHDPCEKLAHRMATIWRRP